MAYTVAIIVGANGGIGGALCEELRNTADFGDVVGLSRPEPDLWWQLSFQRALHARPPRLLAALFMGTVATRLSAPFVARGQSLLSPNEAARHLLGVIAKLKIEDSGNFFDWRGTSAPGEPWLRCAARVICQPSSVMPVVAPSRGEKNGRATGPRLGSAR